MKETKDNFTKQAGQYAKYRPDYPPALYGFLFSLVSGKHAAWDCGTGNGQVALKLAGFFDSVYASDLSDQQIKNAVQKNNVFYSVARAEASSFDDNSFELITVAQAIHWFDFDSFYKEVNRVIKPKGIFAVIGYGLLEIDQQTDKLIHHFYYNIIGRFWDKERKYIDEHYQTIPFPFNEMEVPLLVNSFEWTLDELTGYLETWSAVQHYIKANKDNPVELLKKDLKEIWPGNETRKIKFPILLRVARIDKG